jgi:menaquinone-dependent protoporphyrinogen oxidase
MPAGGDRAMSILVAYVSKYGATEGIAERIAEKLRAVGQDAEVEPAKIAGELTGYDAFVIGSAVYNTHWMKEAAEFVRRNRVVLANSPVWLFSSGPLGTETTDQQGRELITVAEPKEIAEFSEAVNPRGHRVFFGALDRSKLGFAHRAVAKLPAAQALLPQGDFRDWQAIEAWAESIADELTDG